MFRRLSMTDNHFSCLAIFIINLTENITHILSVDLLNIRYIKPRLNQNKTPKIIVNPLQNP